MSDVYSDGDVAARYDMARALPPGTAEAWMEEIKGLLPMTRIQKIVDLGCGTGRFIPALRTTFGCALVGIDPSDAMLREGQKRRQDVVGWICGSAEAIPFQCGSADIVFASQVFHHLDTPGRAFDEIWRVLAVGGCLVVRNGTLENDVQIEWAHCFPEAQELDSIRLPSRNEVLDCAAEHGFTFVALRTHHQYFAASYQEYYDKLAMRGLSSLIAIPDAAFEKGLRRLKQWVAGQPSNTPVYEPVDCFVFQAVK